MRALASLLFAVTVLVSFSWTQDVHRHPLTSQELGSVNFVTSCAKGVAAEFNRGVALLHSFQYEQADEVFTQISGKDPTCAMAQWGIAMANYHGLWDSGNVERGRFAAAKADEIAAANQRTTAREKNYIEAVSEIYRQDGKDVHAHAQVFETKMSLLQSRFPDDSEAAIFHALSLAITAPKTDRTFSNQRKCGEILEPIFQRQPHHPGVAHYLIHCYDNPVLAEKALPAARAYAKIAPASAHAHHMPSHIFTRLGLWDESVSSNLSSANVAAKAEGTSTTSEARDQRLHAMDYLEYAYLQSGRVQQAKDVLTQMRSLPPVKGLTLTGEYAIAAIPARYMIELRRWKEASELQPDPTAVPWAQAITWAAVGIGAAHSGNIERAQKAEQNLERLRDASPAARNNYWSKQVEVQRREVAAWISQASGNGLEAIRSMREAVELEESMDKHPVTPSQVTPAREMLAELLAINKHPRQAATEYEAVLKVAPNRFNALYGAATAADAAGDPVLATTYFRQLTEIAVGDERPELANARKRLAVAKK